MVNMTDAIGLNLRFLKLLIALILTFTVTPAFAAKRVLVLYSTGGHATAARSVEKLLNENPGEFEVIRHDFAEELSGFARWFYFGGYDLISQRANWMNRWGVRMKWWQAERSEVYASERFNADFNQPEKILAYIEKLKPDVIITTHFSVADTLAALREEGHFKQIPIAWTHLDVVDNTYFRQLGDQLDMSFLPTNDMALEWRKVIGPDKVSEAGIPIMPDLLQASVTDNRQDIRASLGLDPSMPTVMLMGGSMGALSYEMMIKEISNQFGPTPVQFIAVCGRNAGKAESLKAWSTKRDFPANARLLVTGFVDHVKVRELQNASDLIISKPGGLTTFELLTTGKPLIMAEGIGLQEKYNAEFVQSEGAAVFLPKPQGLIGPAVFQILKADPDKQQKMIASQSRLRVNFQLQKIVEWTRTARVLQPERPAQTVLARTRAQKKCEFSLIEDGI